MRTTYILILIITLVIMIVFIYIEPLISKHKIKNSNEYGSARFSSVDEIKKNFKKEKISK